MKKYKTTKKHPELKRGLVSVRYGGHIAFRLQNQNIHLLNREDVIENIQNGWIEETQEPEFTIKDVINNSSLYRTKLQGVEIWQL